MVTEPEAEQLREAAASVGVTLSSWLRALGLREAARIARRMRGSLVSQLVHAVDQEA